MTLLVTGGTGYLGGAVVRVLAKDYALRLLVRDPAKVSIRGKGIEPVQGDIRDRTTVRRAIQGCEGVLHLAAVVKRWVRRRSLFEEVNVEGFRNVAESAWEAGVQRFLYTSSVLALDPTENAPSRNLAANAYVASKQKALALARTYQTENRPLMIMIPTLLYGRGNWTEGNHISYLLKSLLSGTFPGWIDGGRWRWNFAYVEDVAAGYRLAIEKGKMGEEYLLGGETVSVREFFTRAARIAGCPLPGREIPYPALWSYALLQEFLAGLFSKEPALTRGILATYRHDWDYRDQKARETLGYTSTSLDQALTRTMQWLKEDSSSRL